MIVEKPDILKQWMADILEHMSDAQPSKLARYVLALVRKASSEERLRATMLEQLDVFLHESTASFVDRLLAALASGSYVCRPADGRVVTLPVAPPPRRQVRLPPDEADSPPAPDSALPPAPGGPAGSPAGSPACTDRVLSSGRVRGPVERTEPNGRPVPPSSDVGPVTDLRQRLGAARRRRGRCRDYDERGVSLRGDDRPFDPGSEKVVLPSDVPTPAPTPYSQPQSPPVAAVAEPGPPGLTPSVVRPSLPAGAAREQLATTPAADRTVSHSEQNTTRTPDTCSLHLRGIPSDLNQIMPLNEHMSRYGRIVNLQVSFGDDPGAALVTFDSPEEAAAALDSTEPVLGCPQITVRPHSERPSAVSGQQMALSGLKRTVANPEAARRISEQDSTATHQLNNGDTSPSAAGTQEDPPDPQREQQSEPPAGLLSGEETAAAAAAAPRQPSQEAAEARRQGVHEIRRSQNLMAASIALEAKRKEKQQAARRLAAELQRREADLLERQLEQQRDLLARLDSPGLRPAERQTLLAALRALQAASLSTRAGLAAALERDTPPRSEPTGRPGGPPQRGALRRAHPADDRDGSQTDQPAAKLPAGLPQETEREVLDLELALYQRQLAGAETEELQRRLSRLRQSAAPTRGRGRGIRARGRGRGRMGRGGALSGRLSSIDRRPSTLIVSDFTAVGREATVAHLARFGEVTDCRPAGDPAALVVTFGTRRQAEAALAGGATAGLHRLTLSWPSTAPAAAKVANNGVQGFQTEVDIAEPGSEPVEGPHASLSDFEDEEGDDADDEDERSWRP